MGVQFMDDRFFIEPIEDSDQDSEISESYEDSETDEDSESDEEYIEISETKEELAYQIDKLLCEKRSLNRLLINEREINKILKNDKLKLEFYLIHLFFITMVSLSVDIIKIYINYIYEKK